MRLPAFHYAFSAAFVALLCLNLPTPAQAAQGNKDASYEITITKGHFQPDSLTIPAGQQVKIMVHNSTTLPAEFESYDITVEKVIPGGTTLPIFLGPLKPGTYGFFNDFAQGVTGKLVVE